jgi:hypothetical protein
MIRKVFKVVGALLATVVLFLVIVANYGTTQTRLVCPGELRPPVEDRQIVTTPATLYAQVEEYRWIVFWSDHDAMIRWEIQPPGDFGFGYYDDSSFGTPITDLERTKSYGAFSSLSGRINVESFDGRQTFEGQCK